jgi:uridine phosphorylase
MTELDALANIDSRPDGETGIETIDHDRVGTSGGKQPHCPIGSLWFRRNRSALTVAPLLCQLTTGEGGRFRGGFPEKVNWSPYHVHAYV